ncbi:MAG: methyl-accepting chemotaxis protein [Treponema sp.]|nr:methyl-accepting chemotaxis protein [Treponema sp.]
MKTERKSSMAKKFILVLGSGIVILFVCMTLLVTGNVRSSVLQTYLESADKIAAANAAEISNWVRMYTNDLRVYADSTDAMYGTVVSMTKLIRDPANKRMQNVVFNDVLVCGADGTGYCNTGDELEMQDSPGYKAMMHDYKNVFISEPKVSETDGSSIIEICRPLERKDNTRYGYVSASLGLKYIQDIIDELTIGNNGFAYIVSGNGIVLAHKDKSLVLAADFSDGDNLGYAGLSAVTADMKLGNEGYGFISYPDKSRHLISYAPVDNTSWSLAIDIPSVQVNETADFLRFYIVTIMCIIVAVLLVFSGIFITVSIRPLRNVESSINRISLGEADLTQVLKVKSHDEVGSLVKGFNKFVARLRSLVKDIKDSKTQLSSVDLQLQGSTNETAGSITGIISNIESIGNQITNQNKSVDEAAGAVNEIARNIESLGKMIQNQSSGVVEASAAVEEMIANILSVNNSVKKMALAFSVLETDTKNGFARQSDVNDRITLIESQSQMLQNANTAIAKIAAQTNLLAMNAAIEAAHAGDSGKGFSVVSDEIRKLSETSSEQSRTIKDELGKIEESIAGAVEASTKSSGTFSMILKHISDTDELVKQIEQAMSEQQTGSKQISDVLKIMNDTTVEVQSASSGMEEGNKAVLEEMKHLQDAASVMKNSMEKMSAGADSINRTGEKLAKISALMNDSINRIGSEIDLFKV